MVLTHPQSTILEAKDMGLSGSLSGAVWPLLCHPITMSDHIIETLWIYGSKVK